MAARRALGRQRNAMLTPARSWQELVEFVVRNTADPWRSYEALKRDYDSRNPRADATERDAEMARIAGLLGI